MISVRQHRSWLVAQTIVCDPEECLVTAGKRSKKLVLAFCDVAPTLPDHNRKNFLDEERTRIKHLGRYRADPQTFGGTEHLG